MGGKRTHVAKITKIERLMKLGLTSRAIARALGVSRNTVKAVREMEFGQPTESLEISADPSEAKWTELVQWNEIQRSVLSEVSLQVLWSEQVEDGRVPVQYPAFWKQYEKRFPESRTSMHRVFEPGSRVEIDYCDGIGIFEPTTGEILKTELFDGVLCHSRYAFAEFSLTQKSEDFLRSHVRMFEYFGGVPQVASPDTLKSAVTKAHRYDPVLNPAYTKLAEYYDVGILPAQVRSPKHKAIVERMLKKKKGGQTNRVTRTLDTGTILRGENPLLRGETLFHEGTMMIEQTRQMLAHLKLTGILESLELRLAEATSQGWVTATFLLR